MPEEKYEPLTPDGREEAQRDAHEKPYYQDFRYIVLSAERLAHMTQCGAHSKEELEEAASDVFESIATCIPATAISILDTDDAFVNSDEIEDQFGGKIQ